MLISNDLHVSNIFLRPGLGTGHVNKTSNGTGVSIAFLGRKQRHETQAWSKHGEIPSLSGAGVCQARTFIIRRQFQFKEE